MRRRYEDLAECIHQDIARDRGLLCLYSRWLDFMMAKVNLPEEFRRRHSLVLTDSQGRHIGCSGAVKNTLEYFNPISPSQQEDLSQSQEAVMKSRLSAKLSSRNDKQGASNGKRGGTIKVDVKATEGAIEIQLSGHHVTKTGDTDKSNNESLISHTKNSSSHSLPPPVDRPPNNTVEPFVIIDGTSQEAHTKLEAMVSEVLRPDSSNSYYARVDEAFRKHRQKSSNTAWEKTDEGSKLADVEKSESPVETKESGHKTSRLDDLDAQSPNIDPPNTRRSKFCTIL